MNKIYSIEFIIPFNSKYKKNTKITLSIKINLNFSLLLTKMNNEKIAIKKMLIFIASVPKIKDIGIRATIKDGANRDMIYFINKLNIYLKSKLTIL